MKNTVWLSAASALLLAACGGAEESADPAEVAAAEAVASPAAEGEALPQDDAVPGEAAEEPGETEVAAETPKEAPEPSPSPTKVAAVETPKPKATAVAAASGKSYYQEHIAPVLTTSCATCHLTGSEMGEIALVPSKAIASMVNVPSIEATNLKRVVPGKPDQSYLIMKLEGTHLKNGGSGAQMPFGAPPLSADKIAKFRTWIEMGAKP